MNTGSPLYNKQLRYLLFCQVYSVLGDRLDCAEALLKAGANVGIFVIFLHIANRVLAYLLNDPLKFPILLYGLVVSLR